MLNFVIRRLFLIVVLVLTISIAVFVLMRSSGDPVELLLPIDATQEMVEDLREEMGLNQPLYVQYFMFLKNIATGRLESLRMQGAVLPLVMTHFGRTLELVAIALCISFALAIPLGVIAATNRGTVYDGLALLMALLGQSIPFFWLALMLIQLFSVKLKMLPVSGLGPLPYWILPITTIVSYNLAILVRMIRSSMLDVLGEEYVKAARAKGLKEFRVLGKHAFRNASIGVITLLSVRLAEMMGGVLIIEVIFSWPGIGRLLYKGVLERDYPVVLGGAFIMALGVGIINLVVDLIYGWIDPRIRIS